MTLLTASRAQHAAASRSQSRKDGHSDPRMAAAPRAGEGLGPIPPSLAVLMRQPQLQPQQPRSSLAAVRGGALGDLKGLELARGVHGRELAHAASPWRCDDSVQLGLVLLIKGLRHTRASGHTCVWAKGEERSGTHEEHLHAHVLACCHLRLGWPAG